MYSMTPISNGTRIRPDHNVFNTALTSVNADVVVTGDELWTATADGNEVTLGDQWLKVTYGMFTGWMARIHKGVAICDNFKVVDTAPPPVPPVNTDGGFPESFYYLENPQGVRVKYLRESQ